MTRRPSKALDRQRTTSAGGGVVRIVGGRWRGTRLPVADVPGLRPTSDRVRETLFNWLQQQLPGARVLDVFAGTGALGLEAVSRGAREAWLVERDPRLAETLNGHVERLKAEDQVRVVRADALSWLQAPLHDRFDVVFLDPPFEIDAWASALARLSPWLSEDALLYLETPVGNGFQPGAGWALHREGSTRDVHYALYRAASPPAATLAADLQRDHANPCA